ncbi:hypothetical protein WOLCODRAFT_162648 [Wolfiporia cocos MD-104 SS10]|uniref:Uncharacterized protein n=1 Tax=Wolfiporia cocos (strain MD-104) TaxID=742152 RepID=A0A2H3JQ23_WOLCO|nr:hypothetical protein WOLCODRAFT_162648 [Wolfiporia cocos MD-104 SS10]
MPGIIQRHTAAAQYASELSTTPRPPPLAAYTADASLALRRARAYPELTQPRIFAYLAPPTAFAALIVCAARALPTARDGNQHGQWQAEEGHTTLVRVLGMVLGALVALRVIIWCAARVAALVAGEERAIEGHVLLDVCGTQEKPQDTLPFTIRVEGRDVARVHELASRNVWADVLLG